MRISLAITALAAVGALALPVAANADPVVTPAEPAVAPLAAPAASGPLTVEEARAAIVAKAKGDLHRYPDYYRVKGGDCWRVDSGPAVACDVITRFGDDMVCVEQMVAHRDSPSGRIEVDALVGGARCSSV